MLQALYETLLGILRAAHASEELIGAYKESWNNTLMGRSRVFPCPECFMAGRRDAALKPMPARGNTFHVKCELCDRTYSYVDEDL
jgi:hypothetical protein